MSNGLRLYNTLTRKIEPFETIEPGKVRMYVCGVTPYASAHIGHGMSVITFDMIRRYLEFRGYSVTHIQNFTDIDDKIIVRANREGISAAEVTDALIEDWHRETAELNVLPASRYPRATTEIPAIVEMIAGLIERGHAYEAEGDVYYRVRSFDGYGKLSGRSVDEMLSGARIEIDERKEDPLDFALWKAAKVGEPHWPSPWSDGRPGWHIECSAMCSHHLNGVVDIHGGGADLIFPHHENEIAQSEAYLGRSPFSRYWLHNGLLQLGGDKMSKSIGNIVSLREILDQGRGQAFRMMVLQSHYRSPLTYTEESLEAAQKGLERLIAAANARGYGGEGSGSDKLQKLAAAAEKKFVAAMDDDFNSPAAIAILFELAREINRERDAGASQADLNAASAEIKRLAAILGFDLATSQQPQADIDPLISLLLKIRGELRTSKQWQLSDMIRDELLELGIEIADSPTGPTWRFIKT